MDQTPEEEIDEDAHHWPRRLPDQVFADDVDFFHVKTQAEKLHTLKPFVIVDVDYKRRELLKKLVDYQALEEDEQTLLRLYELNQEINVFMDVCNPSTVMYRKPDDENNADFYQAAMDDHLVLCQSKFIWTVNLSC